MNTSSNNTPEASSEQNETTNKDHKNDFSYYKELSRKFARKKLSWDDISSNVKDVNFYNDFNWKKYNKDKFLDDFKRNLSWDDLKKILKLTEEEKNELFENNFSREINKIAIPYERKKEELESLISKRYNLNTTWKSNIQIAIKKLNSLDLDNYIYYPEELEKFVKNITKSLNVKPNNLNEMREIFKNFTFKSSQEFIDVIDKKVKENQELWTKEEVLKSLTLILHTLKSWWNLDAIDIGNIFSFGIFNDEQKKNFLKIFLPAISLQELVDLGISTEEDAKKLKKEELISYLKKRRNVESINEDDNELIEILNDIDLKDIIVSTDKYIDSHIVQLQKSSLFNEVIAKSFNNTTQEIKEEVSTKIQTLDILKKKIQGNPTIINKIKWWYESLWKLGNWSILKFDFLKDNNSYFFEVSEFLDNWKFFWKDRSMLGKYNSSSWINNKESNYSLFYEFLSQDKLKDIEIITPDDLKSRIESWNIEDIKEELGDPWKKDFENYKDKIDKEIEALKLTKTKEELEKSDDYKKLLEIKEILSKENAMEDSFIKEELNLFLLASKIDELDDSWKIYWFKPLVSFKCIDCDDEEFKVYTITHIDNLWKTIEIINPVWDLEKISFDKFYNWFKSYKWKITRFTSNWEFSWLVDAVSGDSKLSSEWSKFEIKDGNIMKKTQENITYPFLVQDKKQHWKADQLLKIHNITWTWPNQKVWISFWEVWQEEKDTGKKDKDWKPIKEKIDSFWVDSTIHYVSVWFLENYIKKHELKPKTLEKEKEEKDFIKKWKDPEWWFFKWFLSNKSMHEIVKWIKMWFTEFQNHLKWWSEEHAAKIALSTWWTFLPTEVKTELQARVEAAEKKHMDDYVWRLETMDSWQAVELINKRLRYKNTEEYKKEAWLMFMLKKYWNLYNKPPLNAKRWEFLWFKSLSWYWWDVTEHPLYKQVKEDCLKENRNFTEEELIWILMKKQCSEHGYQWIHRRSRLHKEVEKFKKSWVMEEYDDWVKKSWETRNPKEQLRKWIGEFTAGSPGNWVWWFQWLIDRWASMQDYNIIPFMLIYSWSCKNYSDTLSNKIKWVIDSKRPVLLARFMSYPTDIDLAKETLRILAKKIQEYNPALYPTIWDDAEKLNNFVNSPNNSDKQKLEACLEFYRKPNHNTWKTYGDIMTRAMYNLADWRSDKWDDVNVVLLLNKDKPWKDNKVLKDYYDKFMGFSFSNNYSDDDYMSDSFASQWTSSFWPNVSQTVLLQWSEWWYRMKKSWSIYAKEVINEILAIKNRTYPSKEIQKFHLDHYLKMLFKWLFLAHWTNPDRITPLFKDPWELAILNNKRWVNYKDIVEEWLSERKIDEWEWQHLFDRFVNNILEDKLEGKVSESVFSILEHKYPTAEEYYEEDKLRKVE